LALTFSPLAFGKPISPRKITIISDPSIHADCEVKRSIELLKRVYRMHGFDFDVNDSTTPPPDHGCSTAASTIYLGPTVTPDAAHSIYQDGCRYIGVDPEHLDFCSRTIAHEFGHHRYGDVGMPGWLTLLLNPLCDFRNNFIIRLGTG